MVASHNCSLAFVGADELRDASVDGYAACWPVQQFASWRGAGAKGFSMKIHAGYEISYDCPQPTPMILMLSVHPSRFTDLLTEDRMRLDPPIPAKTYHDSFGNFCHVIRAPSGRLTLSTDFLVHDNGESDATAPQAEQYALEDLPAEALIYLLGSRYCETDRLSNVAWSLFGQVRKGWPLVQAIWTTATPRCRCRRPPRRPWRRPTGWTRTRCNGRG